LWLDIRSTSATQTTNPNERFQRLTLDWLLGNCSSHIRFNDDRVYEVGTYRPWYVDLENLLPGSETFNITLGVSTFRMYSPCSLWFTDPAAVTVIVYGDPTCFQDPNDIVPPPPVVIYDNVNDSVGGDSIPLVAVEEVGISHILVSGTTFFSDYDYGSTEYFDNDVFVEHALEWMLGADLETCDVSGPEISGVTVIPEQPVVGQGITVTATVSDPAGVDNVTLYYQVEGGVEQAVEMTSISNNTYQGTIPAAAISEPGNVTFYLKAYDVLGNWRKTVPAIIIVSAPPPGIWLVVVVVAAVILVVVVVALAVWWLRYRKVKAT